MAALMNTSVACAPGLISDASERRREQQIGDIADWYRTQVSYDDVKRSGRDISVMVDYPHRLILVTSCAKNVHPFLDRVPPDARMEFDADVLSLIQQGLQDKNHLVIVDTSDIPGYAAATNTRERSVAAKITVMEIGSGDEVGTPTTITKPKPQLPTALRERLLCVPKMVNNVAERDYVAERYLHEYLNTCIAPGAEMPASRWQRRDGSVGPDARRTQAVTWWHMAPLSSQEIPPR